MAIELFQHRVGSRVIYGSSAPCRDVALERALLLRQSCFVDFVTTLQKENIGRVIVLLTDDELEDDYNGSLLASYQAAGFLVMRYAIPDYGVPREMRSFVALERRLVEITAKERILIHCGAGIGRTGLVLCGLHVALGASARQALAKVRKVRPGSVENPEQEEFIRKYAEKFSSVRNVAEQR